MGDPDYRLLLQDIEVVEEIRQQKSVSLNIEERKAEQEARRTARLTRENERRKARGLESIESLDDIEDEEGPDVLLNQAAEILTDLVSLEPADSGSPVLSRAETADE